MFFDKAVAHSHAFICIDYISSQFFDGNLGRVELRALHAGNNLLLLLLCHGQVGS